ncbi:MAG: ATP-binding cassette domain-containing protein [Opitutus sp.]|nr:ATP-binding cassette domain-containing protein [Opitutus sp.]MCS6299769.1 ATP-binding cassette domain-containing protein [Opitutus sp.]
MFRTQDLTVTTPDGAKTLLAGVAAEFPRVGLHAVVGPSGCGKTTLVKALLGLVPSTGRVEFDGAEVDEPGDLVGRVGFAPQFSIANPKLTVEESLAYALDLLVADDSARNERLDAILTTVGLDAARSTRVENLSGGQLRRLGLGLELVNDPDWLVCDEVTSGLDPRSEDQILEVLRGLATERGKSFICIIHNLSKLRSFDRITVLGQGAMLFQGSYPEFLAHFKIEDPLQLYERLNEKALDLWKAQWVEVKSSADFQSAFTFRGRRSRLEVCATLAPGCWAQTWTLLRRRWQLFWRDRGNLMSVSAITFGFPVLVAIFALGGLPQISAIALDSNAGFLESLQQSIRHQREATQAANLVVGLVLFQVILLGLTGTNNGAREIAGERMVFEKERMNGLRASAYALSKVIFFTGLAGAQGAWMAIFVKSVCRFPGQWWVQITTLALSCVAMTLVSLGISAVARTAERASFSSVFLVGMQLPLSGVVLALPSYLLWICRPFVNAFWAWAGYFNAMTNTRIYDAFRLNNERWLPTAELALVVLALQALAGVGLVVYGCRRLRWGEG